MCCWAQGPRPQGSPRPPLHETRRARRQWACCPCAPTSKRAADLQRRKPSHSPVHTLPHSHVNFAAQVVEAFKILTGDPQVKAILVNIFGGSCRSCAARARKQRGRTWRVARGAGARGASDAPPPVSLFPSAGGIMKCDVIASGIVNAAKQASPGLCGPCVRAALRARWQPCASAARASLSHKPATCILQPLANVPLCMCTCVCVSCHVSRVQVGVSVPLVVRLEGTNVARGKEILASAGLKVGPAGAAAWRVGLCPNLIRQLV